MSETLQWKIKWISFDNEKNFRTVGINDVQGINYDPKKSLTNCQVIYTNGCIELIFNINRIWYELI